MSVDKEHTEPVRQWQHYNSVVVNDVLERLVDILMFFNNKSGNIVDKRDR